MKHGTITAYRHHGCRCDECKAVQALYNRRDRERRRESGALNHGVRSAYDAGCRCDKCRNVRRVAYFTLPGEYQPKKRRRLRT